MDNINIIGTINNVGFGTHTINMIKAFNKLNIKTSLRNIINDNVDIANLPNEIKTALQSDVHINSNTLYLFHHDFLPKQSQTDLIVYSVFETDRITTDVIYNLNKYSKIVLTPTQEHKDILLKNGISKPIYVVHEGIDIETFNINNTNKLIDTQKYTFLLVGKNEKRKNTNKVLSAFIQTMQYENVALICHTYNSLYTNPNDFVKNWYIHDLTTLGYKLISDTEYYIKYSNSYSDIYLTKPILTTDQLKQLYVSSNVGISYSAGEGWGLPEMEMMACGVPVIISNVLGHKEYITDMPVFKDLIIEPIGKELANDGIYFDGNMGYWSKLDVKSLSDKLIYAYTNNIGQHRSKELSNYYTSNFDWVSAAKHLTTILT